MAEIVQVKKSRNEIGLDYANGFAVIWIVPPFGWKHDLHKTAAIIDLDDVELVKDFRWKLRGPGYIGSIARKGFGCLYLHRLVMGIGRDDKRVVDHINRTPTDCRKANLRICSQQQNCRNRNKRNGRSGFIGVSWDSNNLNWRSKIKANGKTVCLGSFANPEDAAIARDIANRIYDPAFTIDNFPEMDHTKDLIERICEVCKTELFRKSLAKLAVS